LPNTKVWMRRLTPAFLLAAAVPAAASTFNISPVRVELDAVHRMGVLTLTNADQHPVVVELRIVKWSQTQGADRLVDTRDLLATPPVLQIPAGAAQIIRVALRRAPDPVRELSYRVIFQEVPQAAPKNFTGLRVALRLSVPVFVAPNHGKAAAALSWAAHWLPDGRLDLQAANGGTAHLQVTDFDVDIKHAAQPLRAITAKYILPGSRASWTLRAPADADRLGPIVIHGHSDQGDFSADVASSGS